MTLALTLTLRELSRFTALVAALTQRHLATRYRGSVLGFLWSILNPLCLMLVYFLVFHYYLQSRFVDNYPLFLFCGLLPWLWTASALNEGTAAIVSGGHLITKSMFPPHILPTVAVLTTFVNFLLTLPLLVIFMLIVKGTIAWTFFYLPVLLLLHGVFLWGLVLLLSSLNVLYRDVQHIVGNLLGFLFFLCPIVYPASIIPAKFRVTIDLNPLALLTECYHKVLLFGEIPAWQDVLYLAAWALASAIIGSMVYQKHRETFAELL